MKGRLGARLLGAFGLLPAAVSAAWGAGLFDRPTPPPGAIAATEISITVGQSGFFPWTGEQLGSSAGVVLGLLFLTASIVWTVRTRGRPGCRTASSSS
jgi:hypothetical protein